MQYSFQTTYKFLQSKTNNYILHFVLVFFTASVLTICTLMYRIFSNNLIRKSAQHEQLETIDIIDYMAQTSGESPVLI